MSKTFKKYIAITGAAGFIGSHLAEALLKSSYRVIGIDNLDPFYDVAIKESNLAKIQKTQSHADQFVFYKADITKPEELRPVFDKHPIELVIHLAARAGVRPSIEEPAAYVETNINGTINILEEMKQHGIKHLIMASSSSVYGNNPKTPFSETDNVDNPISPYAATKKADELLCYTYAHLYGIHTAMLRFFTVYGPRQRPDLAIHKFTKLISEDKPVPKFGDGETRRDYTYINDTVDGILKTKDWILQPSDTTKYEIFNLGESHTVTLNELIAEIESALNKRATIQHFPMQPGDVECTFADITKAKTMLGYNPTTLIKDGIPRFVAWFQNHQKEQECSLTR